MMATIEMARMGAIRQEVLNRKCSLCSNLLTVAPITTSMAGNEFRCGRCKDISSPVTMSRNFFFESIASYLTLPCTYENCDEILEWNEAIDHEDICRHKKMLCPQENCRLVITLGNLRAHMTDKHKYSVKTILHESVPLLLNITDGKVESKVLLLIKQHLEFILFIHNEGISVHSIGQKSQYQQFTVNMFAVDSTQNQMSISFENQKVVAFKDRMNCIKCLDRTCQSVLHPFSIHYSNAANLFFGTKISWSTVATRFNNTVNFTCSLIENVTTNNVLSLQTNHFEELVECTVCSQYMNMPIHTCEMGHSICAECKAMIGFCPSCGLEYHESRNFAIQQLMEILQFPCKFWINGCSFMDNAANIREHEENCQYY